MSSTQGPRSGKDKGPYIPPPATGFRGKVQAFLNDMRVEISTMVIVVFYMLLVLVDYTIGDKGVNPEVEDVWNPLFAQIDLVFIIFFSFEICVRLYAFDKGHFYNYAEEKLDYLNIGDGLIVVVSLVMEIVKRTSDVRSLSLGFLRLIRLVRLVRLLVVMNKLQKARAAIKKAKYLKLGSPVERVMDLLNDLKTRSENEEDQADLSWIMGLITTDKLYAVDLQSLLGGNAQLSAFFANEMGVTKQAEGEGGEDEGADDAEKGDQEHASHHGNTSAERGAAELEESQTYSPAQAAEVALVDELVELPDLKHHWSNIHEWDFDLFDFIDKSRDSALVATTHYLLHEYGLIERFRLSKVKMLGFLRKLKDGYLKENPYHNANHALDVLLNTNYFTRQEGIQKLMQPLDQLATLLAAAMHDYNHPGLTNNFLAATKHEYAITYNDQSILESMHVAASWKLLLTDECNFIKGLSKEQYTELRDTIIQIILGTDMKYHFEHLTKFKTKVANDTFVEGCERADVKFLLSIAMHTGDIANPAKPMKVCLQWTELVMEEFYRQGDIEAKLGMPISPFYDREKTSVAQCQMGFINVLVKPLYVELTSLLGEPTVSDCLGALQSNLDGWQQHGNAYIKMSDNRAMRSSP